MRRGERAVYLDQARLSLSCPLRLERGARRFSSIVQPAAGWGESLAAAVPTDMKELCFLPIFSIFLAIIVPRESIADGKQLDYADALDLMIQNRVDLNVLEAFRFENQQVWISTFTWKMGTITR